MVNSTNDLKHCLLVCKSWCQCGVELLWHKPVFSSATLLVKSLLILQSPTQTFPYATFIKRLNFSSMQSSMSDSMLARLSDCIRLERLTLTGATNITDIGACLLMGGCHCLVALDLSDCVQLSDQTMSAIGMNCPRLQGLNLTGCIEVTDAGIYCIASRCTMLKRVCTISLYPLPIADTVSGQTEAPGQPDGLFCSIVGNQLPIPARTGPCGLHRRHRLDLLGHLAQPKSTARAVGLRLRSYRQCFPGQRRRPCTHSCPNASSPDS